MYPDSRPKGLPALANDALEQGAKVVVKRKLRRPAERVGSSSSRSPAAGTRSARNRRPARPATSTEARRAGRTGAPRLALSLVGARGRAGRPAFVLVAPAPGGDLPGTWSTAVIRLGSSGSRLVHRCPPLSPARVRARRDLWGADPVAADRVASAATPVATGLRGSAQRGADRWCAPRHRPARSPDHSPAEDRRARPGVSRSEPDRCSPDYGADVARSPAGCRAAALHCVGLTPKRRRNHREKALGAVKPSSSETSVSE